MGHGQNIYSYLNEFLEVLDGLISVGIDLNKELRTIVLLSSLPEQFENFVVAIETRDELPSVETLCIKLKEEGESQMSRMTIPRRLSQHRTKILIRTRMGRIKEIISSVSSVASVDM